MTTPSNKIYEFGPYRLDSAERVLLRDGQPVALTLKAFDVLLLLVKNSGHIVEKDELMNRVWAGSFVEEGNLKVTISMVRKALEDNHDGNRYVETVPRRGYRFVADVKEISDETVDLVIHERRRETLTIDDVGAVDEQPEVQPRPADRHFWHRVTEHKLGLVIGVLAIATAIVFLGFKYVWPKLTAKAAPPFTNFKITALTTSGKVQDASISPDGKYVVYVALDGPRRSLWMKHIPTASDTPITGPEEFSYGNLTFSPNGDQLYYLSRARDTSISLYQMPVFGGTPRKLATDVDSTVTLAPDSKQLAFMRGYPAQQQACVIVANADGSGERKLAVHHIGDLFLNGPSALAPSWSPDGELIAFPFRNYRGATPGASLMAVQVKDGLEKPIASGPWQSIGSISWLRDGSGLVFIAAEQDAEPNGQIWYVSYPGGKVRRIKNDLNDYQLLSVSADSTSLVTVQNQQNSNLWTTSNGYDDPVQISTSKYDGQAGLSWTPDGRLVYVSKANRQSQIWITNADGTGKKQLTFDDSWKGKLDVSPDGRYVVFGSGRADISHIWRMDIGGGNEVQLSRGRENRMPHITFDSRWVVYTSFDTGSPTLWKVPITGGEPVQLSNYDSTLLAVSPQDGQIAYSYVTRDEQSRPFRRIALLPLSGGMPGKTVDFVVPANATWAPDGRALTYVESRLGVSNIWSQPIDGGPPKQLTNFTSHRIFRHDWSSDGKRLALARGAWTSDVVLIKDLASAR
ncbi:MAG TPA: winged helix-turn-helix domain-containing protein [Pyrinomonadaceae bacterium]|nr:winged helix-turn-helix domain-containing protein [Pyrinomonadaceae bacterium]